MALPPYWCCYKKALWYCRYNCSGCDIGGIPYPSVGTCSAEQYVGSAGIAAQHIKQCLQIGRSWKGIEYFSDVLHGRRIPGWFKFHTTFNSPEDQNWTSLLAMEPQLSSKTTCKEIQSVVLPLSPPKTQFVIRSSWKTPVALKCWRLYFIAPCNSALVGAQLLEILSGSFCDKRNSKHKECILRWETKFQA